MGILQSRFLHILLILIFVFAAGCEKSKTIIDKPLPEGAFKAEITVENAPSSLKATTASKVKIAVKNVSNSLWPAKGLSDGRFTINVGDHWLEKNGKILVPDSQRSGLPHDIKPGGKVTIEIPLSAPASPGEYIVEYDMVQEQVAWFKDKGSRTAQVNIKVE